MADNPNTPALAAATLEKGKQLAKPVRKYRHILWVVAILIGLIVFAVAIPDYIRTALLLALIGQRYLAGMTVIFGLLALSFLWAAGERVDAWVFMHFNLTGQRPRWLDRVMLAWTQFGNSLFAFGLAAVLFFVRDRRIAYELILGTLTVWLVVELVKAGIRRPRPFETIEKTRVVGYRESGRSFPSGHTTQAFFLVTLLSQYYELGAWAIVLYIMAVLVGITRMYVGAHYPRDVLAGAMLGSVWGLVSIIIDQRFPVGTG